MVPAGKTNFQLFDTQRKYGTVKLQSWFRRSQIRASVSTPGLNNGPPPAVRYPDSPLGFGFQNSRAVAIQVRKRL